MALVRGAIQRDGQVDHQERMENMARHGLQNVHDADELMPENLEEGSAYTKAIRFRQLPPEIQDEGFDPMNVTSLAIGEEVEYEGFEEMNRLVGCAFGTVVKACDTGRRHAATWPASKPASGWTMRVSSIGRRHRTSAPRHRRVP